MPTVVHGLCGATPTSAPRPRVLVARGTYSERYDSAESVEYPLRPGRRTDRYLDLALARTLAVRPAARATLRPALAAQSDWDPTVFFAHNLPQAVPLIDADRHAPVLYAHNQLLRTYDRREARRTLGPAAAIVAVSDYLAEALSSHLPPELRDRVVVVRNGVDAETFAPRTRTDDGVLRVVFVGRTIPEKGPDVLVDAVVRLGRPDVHLLVVGSAGFDPEAPLTDFETSLRRAANPGGARVVFRRFVDRPGVVDVLREADVAVVPSRWPDPCPLTVLEGMAAGAAVVGSATGGIPETVRGAGVLVTPGSVDALAQVIEGLADSPEEVARWSDAGIARARSRTWSAVRDELDDRLAPFVGQGPVDRRTR
ncbi:hypothetical protein ASE27_03215 [Oerskovia sp. Root918]|uniref:glycosyltransferase family 4 protein n=1 Tax=Oerskovia sp. Root918 TaxID=1736607 RepID=UPI0006F55792|nr:glycosyltransferase family 4 protein [Oerskovia sp. Root918]KRD47373.1 hypothetical protein ASE27_03215 [Oerskovia sp. Root918]